MGVAAVAASNSWRGTARRRRSERAAAECPPPRDSVRDCCDPQRWIRESPGGRWRGERGSHPRGVAGGVSSRCGEAAVRDWRYRQRRRASARVSGAVARAGEDSRVCSLLQLARFENVRTSEAGRRFERLSAALRQPRMPRLVRIQARYLVDPRSRRAVGASRARNLTGQASFRLAKTVAGRALAGAEARRTRDISRPSWRHGARRILVTPIAEEDRRCSKPFRMSCASVTKRRTT